MTQVISLSKERYLLNVTFDGELKEQVKLRYMGLANGWLHFINILTGENHLCPTEQFPVHTMKSFDGLIEYKYL